ncbi:MAG: hypothetical protein FWD71_13180 [Oscillospiraceae bacterium]|nr:hypothetical protein [Oscillospiraceae bacterium]
MVDEALSNSIKTKNKKIAIFIGVVTVLFAILRIIVTRFYIDPDVHFYTDNANGLVLSFDWVTALCVVAIAVSSLFIYRYNKDGYKYLAASTSFVQGTQTEVYTSSLAGFLLGASAVVQFYSVFFKNDGLPLGERLSNYIKTSPFDFILFFLTILCAVYFFRTAAAALNYDIGADENYYARTYINSDSDTTNTTDNNQGDGKDGNANKKPDSSKMDSSNPEQQYSQGYIILSFMPILWSFLNIFKCFFDMTKAVNSPVRIYELMCFLALSAYFVSEARMLVGRHKISRFFTYAYLSVIFVAVSAIPNLILSAFWILKTNNSQILYAVEIVFALYIAARIYSQIRYSKFILER